MATYTIPLPADASCGATSITLSTEHERCRGGKPVVILEGGPFSGMVFQSSEFIPLVDDDPDIPLLSAVYTVAAAERDYHPTGATQNPLYHAFLA
jgi:hypothetical protein